MAVSKKVLEARKAEALLKDKIVAELAEYEPQSEFSLAVGMEIYDQEGLAALRKARVALSKAGALREHPKGFFSRAQRRVLAPEFAAEPVLPQPGTALVPISPIDAEASNG